ncbi:DUF3784 domain-containing protein [Bizionia echini]|uniref:DUF3784 domain-containing protein n=1 Tax=Bizionia echini TaxID=649333 RepID=UPI0030D6DAE4
MILTAAIFIICAILVYNFKFYDLIAGFNTMSDDEKATYNIEKIARLFAIVMYSMAAIILIGYALSKWLDNEQIGAYSIIIATLLGVPFLLIKANSKAYKKDSEND